MAGRKNAHYGFEDPGELTNEQLEQFIMNRFVVPLQLSNDEKHVQAALGTLRKLNELIHPMHFLGLIIWGFDRGWTFNRDILTIADESSMKLIYDQNEWFRYIHMWAHPKIRHYRLLKEMCKIKQAIKEKNDGR
jgi:hypothetical protein